MTRPQRKTAQKAKALISSLAKSGALGRKGRYGAKKALSKPQRAQVKAIVRKQEETKYFAQQLQLQTNLDYPIHTPYGGAVGTASDILPLTMNIPVSGGGIGSEALRVGRKITPTKCYVDVELAFRQSTLGGAVDPSTLFANEIYVCMYIVSSKNLKNWTMYANQGTGAPGTANPFFDLLDDGQGGTQAFAKVAVNTPPNPNVLYTDSSLLDYPINTEHYTIHKKKIVKLVRNVGQMSLDGTPGNAPNLPQSCWRGRFYYRLPRLIYDDTPTNVQFYGGYPTNSNVMLMCGSVLASGLSSTSSAGGVFTALDNPVTWSVRNHIWFKDA